MENEEAQKVRKKFVVQALIERIKEDNVDSKNKLPRGRAIEVLSGIFVFYEKPAVFQTFPLFTPR